MKNIFQSIKLATVFGLGFSSTCIAGTPYISLVTATLENDGSGIVYGGKHNYEQPPGWPGTPFPDSFSYAGLYGGGKLVNLVTSADYGLLHSKGSSDCTSSPGTGQVGQIFTTMRCDDDLLISAPGLNGQAGTLTVRMTVDASVTMNWGTWQVIFAYNVNGAEAGFGEYHTGNTFPGPLTKEPYDLTVGFVFGTPFHFDAYFRQDAGISVSEGRSGFYHGDLTAAWAGVTQVLDGNGQPVTNFTVLSESGRNYRNALPNPLLTKRDFNADWKDDIVLQNTVTGAGRVWQMDGTTRTANSVCPVPVGLRIAAIHDFNRDGQPDLVLQNTGTGTSRIQYMNGVNKLGVAGLGTIEAGLQIAAAGDFNGDGKPDLVLQDTTTINRTILWFMDGSKKIGTKILSQSTSGWQIVAAGDFDGDGKPDIVLQNLSTRASKVWYMNGATYVSSASLGALPVGSRIGAIGDFNGDGHPDLVIQNTGTSAAQQVAQVRFMNNALQIGSAALPTLPINFQIRD